MYRLKFRKYIINSHNRIRRYKILLLLIAILSLYIQKSKMHKLVREAAKERKYKSTIKILHITHDVLHFSTVK